MMAELVFVDNIPCSIVGHYGDYIHYCRIDNDTPGEGTVQDHMLVYVPGGECEGCMACVHNCPQKAITLTPSMPGFPSERNPNARYRNPNVSLADIIQANQQRSR